MKFSKFGQVSLVFSVALILASAFTACNNTVTIDYLFVAGNKENPGQIQTFLVDRVSGALSIANGTVSSGGVKPVSMAVSTDYNHLYVANQADNTIVEFSIGDGAKLSSVKTTTMSAEGNTPVAITMNAAGTQLFVANLYQAGCSTATVGAATCNGGAMAVFPVGTDGSLGTALTNGTKSYFPVGVNPTGINTLATGVAAYVTSYNPKAGLGYIYGFSTTTPTAINALNNGTPFAAGVRPSGISSDLTGRFVYVTDFAQNQLIGYSVIDQGTLQPLINGPFRAGAQPTAIQVDPRSKYIYLANSLDNTVSAYAIDTSTGTPSAAVNTTGAATNQTGTQPVAILIDPGFARYVYTANFLDNSITGFRLDASTGSLSITQNGPYPTVGQPTALASIPRGNHSVQIPQP